jgi:amidase
MRIGRRQLLTLAASAAVAPTLANAQVKATGGPGSLQPQRNSQGPLWRWDAADLADAIRRRQITSREATLSALERVQAVNPKLNAIVELLADEALAAADQADRTVRDGGPLGVLHGVPVTTKINVDLRGHPTTNGIVAMKDNIAKADSAVVAAFRKSGAVIIGRTNTPAMSFRWFTENDLHGRTYNPWDRTVTPGGSSGGASSAVSAGMGAIAHGNDIAGSVRYPGYVCGVPAIRPSLGRISSGRGGGAMSGSIMGVEGVLARSIQDLRLGLEATSVRAAGDPWWTPAPLHYPDTEGPKRVALFSRASGYTPAPSVAAALEIAAKALSDAGYVVEEKDLPHFAEGQDLWSRLVMNESRESFGEAVRKFGDERVRKEVLAWLEITPKVDMKGLSEAFARRNAIAGAWDLLMEDYPIILMPNSWEPPMKLDRDQGGPDALREILRLQSPMLLPPLLGVPGLSVPTGVQDGLPTGVQIVSRRFREDLCFTAGEVIERACPMPTPIDPRW